MSQEKVDKYKQEKYNRKNVKQKSNAKKILAYVVATVIAVVFIIYIGYSVAVDTGLYTPPTTTAEHKKLSDKELESLRQVLIDNNDPYVRGVETETTVVADETTVAVDETTEAVEETTEATEETTVE